MRWSIESRVPFLTKDLADFCLSLPENFLLSDHGQTKHILRESMKSIVPKEILDRKDKIGFFTPELIWIKSLRGNVESYLSDLEKIEFIDHEYFYNLIQDVIDEKEEYDPIIWRAINYSRWYSCIAK
jgi:asparagine synthase (glutamine-hydrolysing)